MSYLIIMKFKMKFILQAKPSIKQQAKTNTNLNNNNNAWRQNSSAKQRPPLVVGFPTGRGTSRVDDDKEVQVKNAFRHENSVIIQWDSETSNILGFRVVYRLFADKSFKQGPPLEASEREFKIKNVPPQECMVVCVISLEELNVSPESVPYSQCREVRTLSSPTSNMDKITIAASAAICGTIIVAVIIFIAAGRYESNLQIIACSYLLLFSLSPYFSTFSFSFDCSKLRLFFFFVGDDPEKCNHWINIKAHCR